MTDWRANRLVDVLAKAGAKQFAPPSDVQKLLRSATALAKHFAAQLGEATYVANNFQHQEIGPDGTLTSKTLRDSMDKPRCTNMPPALPPTPLPKSQSPSL